MKSLGAAVMGSKGDFNHIAKSCIWRQNAWHPLTMKSGLRLTAHGDWAVVAALESLGRVACPNA